MLADGITFAQVEQTIRSLGIPELESIEAADLFRGGQISAGKFSLMIRVTFQSAEATFTDAQFDEFSSGIVAALQEKLGAHSYQRELVSSLAGATSHLPKLAQPHLIASARKSPTMAVAQQGSGT